MDDARDHVFRVRSLTDFQHVDNGKDQGAGIREIAKRICELLADTARLREERRKAKDLAGKLVGISNDAGSGGGSYGGYGGGGHGGGGGYGGGGGGGGSSPTLTAHSMATSGATTPTRPEAHGRALGALRGAAANIVRGVGVGGALRGLALPHRAPPRLEGTGEAP